MAAYGSHFQDSQKVQTPKITPETTVSLSSVRSKAGLKRYKLGAQIGTTSYQYIVRSIRPSQSPSVFDTNDAAVAALKNGQIDGLVVDLPTAFYLTAAEIPEAKITGQFAAPGGDNWGVVLGKDSELTDCVNQAIGKLKDSGELQQITDKWMGGQSGAPELQ